MKFIHRLGGPCCPVPNNNQNDSETSEPITNNYAYVEIGGLKWATMNVGATNETDAGLYFQWGDTQGYTADQVGSGEGQKYFSWDDYKYTDDSGQTMTKYNSTDGLTVLESSDDAVQAAWGGSWRMPTSADFASLGDAVTTAWTSDYNDSGVAGIVCTDKTDSSKVLFFPAVHYVENVGNVSNYWSSSLFSSDISNAFYFSAFGSNVSWNTTGSERFYGFPVRGVIG